MGAPSPGTTVPRSSREKGTGAGAPSPRLCPRAAQTAPPSPLLLGLPQTTVAQQLSPTSASSISKMLQKSECSEQTRAQRAVAIDWSACFDQRLKVRLHPSLSCFLLLRRQLLLRISHLAPHAHFRQHVLIALAAVREPISVGRRTTLVSRRHKPQSGFPLPEPAASPFHPRNLYVQKANKSKQTKNPPTKQIFGAV